ncbi:MULTISPECIES: helix-turn-helix domain-containing protein [Vibrio]|uniref:helix-turn-helix domain-containing protein n=1 Tax=Vibrio TaxID=662 RepID=UPI001CDCE67C|nr:MULTISPECIES: helix-turn-helix transcriptional regulator [Vibrio]MCA2422589.1 helix-turn-helix transcriptional regulator [Vibrio alginolyticus]MCA2447227.1 helix-turn-helix transcriptional regulator [Vibrio alginolyticus]MDW2183230.1 helix-turn-helix transcriptional regulator [Vibrio sp. 1762]MDW2226900.1 helix-turn-helix transcriptional regulator [Vibrio sp. 1761]UUM00359.1 hypothetical protein [Vibrio alginolyticus]
MYSSTNIELPISSTVNLLPFIEYLQSKGINWHELALECKIPIDVLAHGHWIPSRQLMLFFYKLEQKCGSHVCFEVGRLASVQHFFKDTHLAILRADSFERGLKILADNIRQVNNHVVIWAEKKEGTWWLCHRSSCHPSALGYNQAEWFRTFSLLNFCRIFLDKCWYPKDIRFSSPVNSSLPTGIPASTQLTFSQAYGAISIPIELDHHTIARLSQESDWFYAALQLLNTYAVLPCFTLAWFAELLGMTPRTLQRKLNERQVTFKALKDRRRESLAKSLLNQSNISVKDIAWQCGYNDVANFNRAFKKWTDLTAPQYRKSCR